MLNARGGHVAWQETDKKNFEARGTSDPKGEVVLFWLACHFCYPCVYFQARFHHASSWPLLCFWMYKQKRKSTGDGIPLLPEDKEQRAVWTQAIKREEGGYFAVTSHTTVSSEHFDSQCYTESKKRKRLKRGSRPTPLPTIQWLRFYSRCWHGVLKTAKTAHALSL